MWNREVERLFNETRRLRARGMRYMQMLMDPVKDADGHYNQDLIPGLCLKQDSCEHCRAVRRADPAYQAFLEQKRALEIAMDSGSESWNDSQASWCGGNRVPILTAWIEKLNTRLADYAARYLR